MALTAAEKQRAYRERQRERLRQLEQAAPGNVTAAQTPGNVTDEAERLAAEIRGVVAGWPRAQQQRFAELGRRVDQWAELQARKRHPEALAEMERERDDYIRENAHMARIKSGLKPLISEADYRFLLGALHPDRQPSPEKQAKAFDIVRKLEPYITAAK